MNHLVGLVCTDSTIAEHFLLNVNKTLRTRIIVWTDTLEMVLLDEIAWCVAAQGKHLHLKWRYMVSVHIIATGSELSVFSIH